MTEVIPFKGILYDNRKVTGSEVIAPPYDVINPALREALYGRSPFNIVRIDAGMDLPEDNDTGNKYTRAHASYEEWLASGVLKRDPDSSFYAYRMDYTVRGVRKSLTGLFGLVKLVELGQGVYPHEATHSKPKHDRLSLMDSIGANTSPIFALYEGPATRTSSMLSEVTSGPAELKAEDADGTVHGIWPVRDKAAIAAIQAEISGRKIFIADGHHRYETALDYRNAARRKAGPSAKDLPTDYVLMFLADLTDPGITILPTHRLVRTDISGMKDRLARFFNIEKLEADADIPCAIEGQPRTFGLYAGGGRYRLTHKPGDLSDINPALSGLDVVVLHELVFGRLLNVDAIAYEMDYETVIGRVKSGEYDAAFFLNSTPVEAVQNVANSRLRMPPKSTYFFPKIQTGFVMNSLKSF